MSFNFLLSAARNERKTTRFEKKGTRLCLLFLVTFSEHTFTRLKI